MNASNNRIRRMDRTYEPIHIRPAQRAARIRLLEDAEDLAACDARLKEPNLDFENFLKDTRKAT